jgi:hypothetical protein
MVHPVVPDFDKVMLENSILAQREEVCCGFKCLWIIAQTFFLFNSEIRRKRMSN